MKVISYSIFKDCPDHLFNYYQRGLYFNLRMNRLLYPDWVNYIHCADYNHIEFLLPEDDNELFSSFIFNWSYTYKSRCESMLWRMHPAWSQSVTHFICRDSDAITTYREMKSVMRWIESGKDAHGMNDSPAHGGLHIMGGMCGFKAEVIRNHFPTFESLIQGYDLTQHGSDQQLLMERVYPLVKDSFYFDAEPQRYYDNPLWESDLTCRHIGSAGVVEMELLRFFERHDPDNDKFIEFEKSNTDLFYWRK